MRTLFPYTTLFRSEDDHEMLDRRLGVDLMRMAIMIAIVVMIPVPAEIVCENRHGARKCSRGRENRSRRQKFGFHLCLPRRSDPATLAFTFDRAVSV